MGNTTKAKVLLIASELNEIQPETWELILSDVTSQISSTIYRTSQERAQRYLAAHLLTLINNSNKDISGPIISEKIGQHLKKYANSKKRHDYDSTIYGREFHKIMKQNVMPFVVVRP